MIESYPLVTTVVVSIVLSFSFGAIANRLSLPTILGYLIAGMIIGPNTPGFVADIHISEQLAEIGIILLMFEVGLHFSMKDLKDVHRTAIPGALIQMCATVILCLIALMLFDYKLSESLVFGITLSIASTIVLLRTLDQHNLTDSKVGKIAIGWLIIEDIAIIIILVLFPIVHSMLETKAKLDVHEIIQITFTIILKIAAFLIMMILLGKKLLPKLLISISKTQSRELMVLGSIAISSGFAFIAYTIFGASFALGSFMAGFILSESKIGRDYAKQSLSLRDTFTVLFFVSTGMLFNPRILWEEPYLILIAFLLVMVGKSVIAYLTMKIFHLKPKDSILLAISLAQIGEFSFILAALSLKLGIFSDVMYDAVIASAIISIAVNPFMFRYCCQRLK